MKKIMIGLVMLLATGVAYSQQNNTDIDVVQSVLGRDKRVLIDEYMQLEDKQKNSFWSIYDQYEAKRKAKEREGFILLKEYAEHYETMNDAEARKLMLNFMKSMDGYNTLYKVYFRKIEKVIGSLKAAKFIQLEVFLQTALQQNVQNQVPMIGEMERLENKDTRPKPEIQNNIQEGNNPLITDSSSVSAERSGHDLKNGSNLQSKKPASRSKKKFLHYATF